MTTSLTYRSTHTKIDTVTLDASVLEVHTSTVDVTDHPVESGTDVSDHARERPFELRIEGVLTDTPLDAQQQRRKIQRGAVTIDSASVSDKPDGRPGASISAYDQLRRVQAARLLVTVVTKLRTYKDLMITSIEVPRDGRTGDALRFTMTLRQVRVVSSQQVTIAQEPRGKKQKRSGDKSKEAVSAEPLTAIAKEALNSNVIGNWLGFTPGTGIFP